MSTLIQTVKYGQFDLRGTFTLKVDKPSRCFFFFSVESSGESGGDCYHGQHGVLVNVLMLGYCQGYFCLEMARIPPYVKIVLVASEKWRHPFIDRIPENSTGFHDC